MGLLTQKNNTGGLLKRGTPQPDTGVPYDATKMGILKNTIKGLPQAGRDVGNKIKQFIAPNRGYSDEEIYKANPTLKETLVSIPRMGAEIFMGISDLGRMGMNAVGIPEPKEKDVIGDKIREFSKPKTAGEAKIMRVGDIATLGFGGSMKNVGKVSKVISKTEDVISIERELKGAGLTAERAKEIAPALKDVKDEGIIGKIIAENLNTNTGAVVSKSTEPRVAEMKKTESSPLPSPTDTSIRNDLKTTIETPTEGKGSGLVADIKTPKYEATIDNLGKKVSKADDTSATFFKKQAEKYKNIDEFLKAQEDRAIVHGGKLNQPTGTLTTKGSKGLFFAENTQDGINYARGYTLKDKEGGKIYRAVLNPEAKIFDFTNQEHRKILEGATSKEEYARYARNGGAEHFDWRKTPKKELLERLGFDGIKVKERSKGFGVFDESGKQVPSQNDINAIQVFNDEAFRVLPDNSELTRLWNEAKGITSPTIQKNGTDSVQGGASFRPDQTRHQEKISPVLQQRQREGKSISSPSLSLAPKPDARVLSTLKKAVTSLLEHIQDSEIRIKQLLERKDLKITDESNPYQKMTLYSGRLGNKIEKGYSEVSNLFDEMKTIADDSKVKVGGIKEEVSNYLKYQHAPERNAVLGDGASGMKTAEALEKMEDIKKRPDFDKIKAVADRVLKLNEQTLDMLKESGVISDELYTSLRTKYKHHVPLNRIFEESDDVGSVLSGKSFDVRSTGIKRAKGSDREVSDIFTNIVTNYEQSAIRAEKNIVDLATLRFVRENKNALKGLMEEKNPKMIGRTFDDMPIMERTDDPNTLQLFENGKRRWVKVEDTPLAVAFRGVGQEKTGTLLNAVGAFTRFYSGLATRFNPEFALPNKIRDLQETATFLASQKDIKFGGALKTLKNDPQSIKAITDYLRGKDTPDARLYAEMKELGGTTGGMGLSTRKQVEINLDRLEKVANSKTRKLADNLVEYVDGWNTIFEDSTRLSVYKTALEKGLSKDRASALAKEASINFNRKGTGGSVINALYMFSNASIQGSTKMVRSLRNPKVLAVVSATIATAVGSVNEWNDMVDSEWRDKVSKWDRLNGLPVMLPSEDGTVKYVTIPVSWGVKPIKVMADYAYDSMSGVDFDPKKMLEDTITSIADAYNPVGGTDWVSSLTPTILDTPVELARNLSWSGNKIKPDYDPNLPPDVQYFSSLGDTKTGKTAISISEILQDKAGIAVSPADIAYAFNSYISGAGRAVTKTFNTIAGFTSDDPVPLDEYPFISRFYRQKNVEEVGSGSAGDTEKIKEVLTEQSRERFKFKMEEEDEFKNIQELETAEEKKAYLKEVAGRDPELAKKIIDVAKDEKLGLTYTDRLIKQLGVENGERAKYIAEELKALETKEEKKAYLKELAQKKLLTEDVLKSLISEMQNGEE